MSHRVIIFGNAKVSLQNSEVRAQLTTPQLNRVDEILQSTEPSDEDFRYLQRRLNQVYCSEE